MKTAGRHDSSRPTTEMPFSLEWMINAVPTHAVAVANGSGVSRENPNTANSTSARPAPPMTLFKIRRCRRREEPHADERAKQQLPGAERGQEKRERRVSGVGQHGGGERQQHAGRDQGVQAPRAKPVAGQHEQRTNDVELLLDRERPGVQQRLGFRRRVEVARRQCKKYVRDVGHGGDHAVGEFLQLDRQQIKIRQHARCQQHGEQRRKQPHDAALVERGDGEAAVLDLVVDQPADQISRDDEKDIDADKAAGHERDAGVIGDDRQNCHSPQSVDIGTIFHAAHLKE